MAEITIRKPRVFGASYSVYVRVVRLALIEKGVDYDLVPIDVFAEGGPPLDHLERHPFGRIPAFAHGDFALYETGAIARYVDEAFAGPRLQPAETRARARCNQLVSIADNYLYPDLVWGLYVERIAKPGRGEVADEARISAALPKAATCLAAMSDLMGDAPWLAGPHLTLADLYAAPMLAYALLAPEAQAIVRRHANLTAWWLRLADRPSMRASASA